ncbi:MAG: hypothetical protein FD130_1379 [Halothiobacillaceae bacterium]|nr:MAG: hypothetical protein FD130_1379 [Halothiobacillaceae bacterium]
MAAVVLLILYLRAPRSATLAALRMLKRMRFFFLSIAILYFWFTPHAITLGEASLAGLPSLAGIQEGALRLVALLLVVVAVNLLLQTTTRDQLLVAIYWYARPLALMGISPVRVAVRITLILGSVDEAQVMVRSVSATRASSGLKKRIAALGALAGQLLHAAISRAQQAELTIVSVSQDYTGSPPGWQWFYPVGLLLFFVLL